MMIPPHLLLSAEDIRYLRHSQLGQLTGIDPSSFSAWSQQRRFSERTLDQLALCLGIPKSVVLQGFELRRQDAATARLAQEKAEKLIAYLSRNSQQERSA